MTAEQELTHLREQLRNTQAQLIQSEKMAALGALTVGVAHELNNPIGFVKNNTVMLGEYLQALLPVLREIWACASKPESPAVLGERITAASGDEDLTPILDDIEPLLEDTLDGILRMEAIVGGLRRFARADTAEGERFDLNQCVSDTLRVVWNKLKYQANLVQALEETPALHGKPGEINLVILNLLVQAAQALPEFGEIRIRTCRLDGEVQLSIADDGPGIPEEDLESLFTSIVTTTPTGKGTGLGLAISRDIVKAHGGRLDVTSTQGLGTEFRVILPIAPETTDDRAE